LLFFVIIFFSCYVDHRYLHSFPTRRSSDLKSSHIRGCCSRIGYPVWICRMEVLVKRNGTKAVGYRGISIFNFERYNWSVFSFIVDRKSTRLNSSHLGISYAVFCLKKKKKKK